MMKTGKDRESAVERYLVKEVEQRGGRVIKLVTRAGIPDRQILWPGGKALFVELKKPSGGVVSARQVSELNTLEALGFTALFATNKQEIDELIQQLEEQP